MVPTVKAKRVSLYCIIQISLAQRARLTAEGLLIDGAGIRVKYLVHM